MNMSILIKGMEMPQMPATMQQGEGVPYIDIRLFADGSAVITKGERPYFTIYNVIPVPPHGRLIDADAFAAEMKKRREEAGKWLREAKDRETAVRADAVLLFLCEVKLTLEKEMK